MSLRCPCIAPSFLFDARCRFRSTAPNNPIGITLKSEGFIGTIIVDKDFESIFDLLTDIDV